MIYERPTVLVDMDGVVADFDGEAQRRIDERLGDIVQRIERPTPAFYTADNFRPQDYARVHSIIKEPRFVAGLPVVPDALDGWERIIEAGYIPQICSRPFSSEEYPTCVEEKKGWLEEYFAPRFGMWVVDTALIVRDKSLCPGAVLIDDYPPPVRNAARASWRQLVFDRPYNRTPESSEYGRLYGWKDEGLERKIGDLALAA